MRPEAGYPCLQGGISGLNENDVHERDYCCRAKAGLPSPQRYSQQADSAPAPKCSQILGRISSKKDPSPPPRYSASSVPQPLQRSSLSTSNSASRRSASGNQKTCLQKSQQSGTLPDSQKSSQTSGSRTITPISSQISGGQPIHQKSSQTSGNFPGSPRYSQTYTSAVNQRCSQTCGSAPLSKSSSQTPNITGSQTLGAPVVTQRGSPILGGHLPSNTGSQNSGVQAVRQRGSPTLNQRGSPTIGGTPAMHKSSQTSGAASSPPRGSGKFPPEYVTNFQQYEQAFRQSGQIENSLSQTIANKSQLCSPVCQQHPNARTSGPIKPPSGFSQSSDTSKRKLSNQWVAAADYIPAADYSSASRPIPPPLPNLQLPKQQGSPPCSQIKQNSQLLKQQQSVSGELLKESSVTSEKRSSKSPRCNFRTDKNTIIYEEDRDNQLENESSNPKNNDQLQQMSTCSNNESKKVEIPRRLCDECGEAPGGKKALEALLHLFDDPCSCPCCPPPPTPVCPCDPCCTPPSCHHEIQSCCQPVEVPCCSTPENPLELCIPEAYDYSSCSCDSPDEVSPQSNCQAPKTKSSNDKETKTESLPAKLTEPQPETCMISPEVFDYGSCSCDSPETAQPDQVQPKSAPPDPAPRNNGQEPKCSSFKTAGYSSCSCDSPPATSNPSPEWGSCSCDSEASEPSPKTVGYGSCSYESPTEANNASPNPVAASDPSPAATGCVSRVCKSSPKAPPSTDIARDGSCLCDSQSEGQQEKSKEPSQSQPGLNDQKAELASQVLNNSAPKTLSSCYKQPEPPPRNSLPKQTSCACNSKPKPPQPRASQQQEPHTCPRCQPPPPVCPCDPCCTPPGCHHDVQSCRPSQTTPRELPKPSSHQCSEEPQSKPSCCQPSSTPPAQPPTGQCAQETQQSSCSQLLSSSQPPGPPWSQSNEAPQSESSCNQSLPAEPKSSQVVLQAQQSHNGFPNPSVETLLCACNQRNEPTQKCSSCKTTSSSPPRTSDQQKEPTHNPSPLRDSPRDLLPKTLPQPMSNPGGTKLQLQSCCQQTSQHLQESSGSSDSPPKQSSCSCNKKTESPPPLPEPTPTPTPTSPPQVLAPKPGCTCDLSPKLKPPASSQCGKKPQSCCGKTSNEKQPLSCSSDSPPTQVSCSSSCNTKAEPTQPSASNQQKEPHTCSCCSPPAECPCDPCCAPPACHHDIQLCQTADTTSRTPPKSPLNQGSKKPQSCCGQSSLPETPAGPCDTCKPCDHVMGLQSSYIISTTTYQGDQYEQQQHQLLISHELKGEGDKGQNKKNEEKQVSSCQHQKQPLPTPLLNLSQQAPKQVSSCQNHAKATQSSTSSCNPIVNKNSHTQQPQGKKASDCHCQAQPDQNKLEDPTTRTNQCQMPISYCQYQSQEPPSKVQETFCEQCQHMNQPQAPQSQHQVPKPNNDFMNATRSKFGNHETIQVPGDKIESIIISPGSPTTIEILSRRPSQSQGGEECISKA